MTKQICLFCKDTGYLTWAEGALDTTCYCDCPAGDAAYHRDDEIMQIRENRDEDEYDND